MLPDLSSLFGAMPNNGMPAYGQVEPIGYYASDPLSGYAASSFGAYADDPYGYAAPFGYYAQAPYTDLGEDPFAAYAEDPLGEYDEYDDYDDYSEDPLGDEPYGEEPYGEYAEDPFSAYAEQPFAGYAEDPYGEAGDGYGMMPEMVGYGEEPPAAMGGYVPDVPSPFNAGCPLPTNVNGFGEPPLEGYQRPRHVSPRVTAFRPADAPASSPEAFRPLW
jgi:hypothetical protein